MKARRCKLKVDRKKYIICALAERIMFDLMLKLQNRLLRKCAHILDEWLGGRHTVKTPMHLQQGIVKIGLLCYWHQLFQRLVL